MESLVKPSIDLSALDECNSYLKDIKTKIYGNEARVGSSNYTSFAYDVNKLQHNTSDLSKGCLKAFVYVIIGLAAISAGITVLALISYVIRRII